MTNRFKSLRVQKFASTRPHDTETVAFSKVCVFIESDTSFSCGRDMKTQQNVYASVWTGPKTPFL